MVNKIREDHSKEDDDTNLIVAKLTDLCAQVADLRAEVAGHTKEVFTTEEVAHLTSRAQYTVRTWIREGRINAVRVSGSGPRGRLLIHRDELKKLITFGRGEGLPGLLG